MDHSAPGQTEPARIQQSPPAEAGQANVQTEQGRLCGLKSLKYNFLDVYMSLRFSYMNESSRLPSSLL